MRGFVSGIALLLVTTLGCYANENSAPRPAINRNSPNPLYSIYSQHAVAALQRPKEIRVDEIARDGNSSSGLFALNEYRLIQPGRVLSPDEARQLRRVLLDPASYTADSYLCEFAPRYAFTFTTVDSTHYFVLANECHLAAMQTAHSRENVNLTEEAALKLGAFCEALFQ
jgi:hypothetical protein